MAYTYGATRNVPSAAELDKMRRAIATLHEAHKAAIARTATLEQQLAKVKAARPPVTTRKRPRKLPEPTYGGPDGLIKAARESADLDRRTHIMIAAGHDSEWIREYKRIHNIK
jgi:hypothetical protein